MKITEQVISLKTAQKLKELGINQVSFLSWFGKDEKGYLDTTVPLNEQGEKRRNLLNLEAPIGAAFTVAELGEMLPAVCEGWQLEMSKDSNAHYIQYAERKKSGVLIAAYTIEGGTEAEARAAMIIHLIESDFTTAEAINICKSIRNS